jgi:hypothetical protein
MIPTERYPYVSEQIAKGPRRSGLLYLFDFDMPLWAQWDGDVQVRLLSLRETYSDATHFAIDFSMNSFQSGEEYAEKMRRAFRLVDRLTAKEPLGFSRPA